MRLLTFGVVAWADPFSRHQGLIKSEYFMYAKEGPTVLQSAICSLPTGRHAALRLLSKFVTRAPGSLYGTRFEFDLREVIQQHMFLGAYEAAQTSWARSLLRPGDTVVDVGANFGYYTALAASIVGSRGRVYAFEPSPVAYKNSLRCIRRSRWGDIGQRCGRRCPGLDVSLLARYGRSSFAKYAAKR